MSAEDLQKQIVELKGWLQYQEMELARIAVAAGEKSARLNNLVQAISCIEIDKDLKQDLITTCKGLLDETQIQRALSSDFTEADAKFLSVLQKKFPHLNQRDLRVIQFIRLDLDSVQIAKMIGISRRGLESVRYRLHKKLGLKTHQSIKTFLNEMMVS